MRLTDDNIKRQPRPAAGQRFLWDDLVSGFGVRLTPNRVTYVVQYRQAGRAVRKSFGHWPKKAIADARREARDTLGDLVTSQSETAGGTPLHVAMRSWYDATAHNWRPRYRKKIDRICAVYIEGEHSPRVNLTPATESMIDRLGKLPVVSVTRGDLLRVADAIKPGAAEQFLAIVSSFYGWASERDMCDRNPARNRLRVTGGRRIRTRSLSEDELVKVWKAFQAEGDPHFGAFEFLVLTGARRLEVTSMQWAEIDLDARTWTLPPERRKTGKKDRSPLVINLAPEAVAILKRQPLLAGSPYVFWGRRDKRPFDFQNALLDRVRKAAAIPHWVLHDLRRTARSGMARLGVSQAVAEMCLGHLTAKPGLVGVYDAHDYADEKKAAWLKWARHVRKLTR